MTYVVNGKKIDASVGALAICIQLLEALSDKEEKCKWCKAGIPENCVEQSDLAETVARLDKQALKDSEMHEIEIPGPTYSDKEKCEHDWFNAYKGNTFCINCKVKKEECDCKEKSCKPDCTTKHTCHVYSCEKCKPKQSTSLKEEIIETIWTAHGQSAIVPNTADKILSLLQSHLIKEIPEEKDVKILGQTWEGKLSAANNCGYNQSREDIIKIINNITK